MLVDYLRDFRDCADAFSETQKFDVYDELQCHIDALKTLGVSLRYAERKMQVKFGADENSKPMPINVLYVVAFPLGKEPEQFATPRSGGLACKERSFQFRRPGHVERSQQGPRAP